MPWQIETDHPDCDGFAVVKTEDGTVEGCHTSHADAEEQLAALYANERSAMTSLHRDDLIRMVELPAAELEFRAEDDNGALGTLRGYAAVYDSETTIDSWEGRFVEKFMHGAFRDTLKKDRDKIKVLFNHGFDPSIGDKPLGKPRTMEERDNGLWVEVPLDATSYNRDLVASLRSGALDGMSIRFSVVREDVDESDPDMPVRTVKQARLYEFGPVTFPAYEATTAGVRARDAYQAWRTAHPKQDDTLQNGHRIQEVLTSTDPDRSFYENSSDDADAGSSDSADTSPTLEPGLQRRQKADELAARVETVLAAVGLDDD